MDKVWLSCSFPEIKALMALQEEEHAPSSKLLDLLKYKIAELENEMERLRQVRAELTRLRKLGLDLTGESTLVA